MPSRLIFGCGYVGQRVARLWADQGDGLTAVTRRPERAAWFRQQGWQAVVADVTDASSLAGLPTADTVLFAVGFDRHAGHAIHSVYVDGLRRVLDALPALPEHFIYISSTGVYGQASEEWVAEEAECEPRTPGGRACWQAEQLLRGAGFPQPPTILRLAGIYGPGRVPRQADLQAGRVLAADAEGYLNLVHVDDAARVVLQVAAQRPPADLYNVSDGHPVRRGTFYRYLAELRGWSPPRFRAPDPESSAGQRALSNKRIDSRRLASEVNVAFRYPSYRQGLAAIVQGSDDG